MYLAGICPQSASQILSTPYLPVGFLDGIMEKEGPQRLAGCSFHENGHQLLCGLELISVHANVLPLEPLTKLCEAHMARHAAADRQGRPCDDARRIW
jgi:hypothetical protein